MTTHYANHAPSLPLALLGLALAGCGGADDSGDDSGGGSCSITLSGAVTATLECTSAVLYDEGVDAVLFGLTVQQSMPTAGANVLVAVPAETGTFTDADCIDCLFAAYTDVADGPAWAMQTMPTMQGSFSVTIDSLGEASSADGTTAYPYAQGSATAVLPAVEGSGATGTVNLSAEF